MIIEQMDEVLRHMNAALGAGNNWVAFDTASPNLTDKDLTYYRYMSDFPGRAPGNELLFLQGVKSVFDQELEKTKKLFVLGLQANLDTIVNIENLMLQIREAKTEYHASIISEEVKKIGLSISPQAIKNRIFNLFDQDYLLGAGKIQVGTITMAVSVSLRGEDKDTFKTTKYQVRFFDSDAIQLPKNIINGIDLKGLLQKFESVDWSDDQVQFSVIKASRLDQITASIHINNILSDLKQLNQTDIGAMYADLMMFKFWIHTPLVILLEDRFKQMSKFTKDINVQFTDDCIVTIQDVAQMLRGIEPPKQVREKGNLVTRYAMLKKDDAEGQYHIAISPLRNVGRTLGKKGFTSGDSPAESGRHPKR